MKLKLLFANFPLSSLKNNHQKLVKELEIYLALKIKMPPILITLLLFLCPLPQPPGFYLARSPLSLNDMGAHAEPAEITTQV